MSGNNSSHSVDLGVNGSLPTASNGAAAETTAELYELEAYYVAMERLTRFVCYQGLGAPVSALGVLGNAVSVAVLTRRSMLWGVASTNCYLVALACSDVLYLLMVNFGVLATMWQRLTADFELEDLHPPAGDDAAANGTSSAAAAAAASLPWRPHPCVLAAVNVLSNTSVWIVVAFTTERYVAVTYPMRGRVLCNPRRAKWTIATVFAAVLLLHVPNFFELDADSYLETDMARHPVYRIGYNWGVVAFLFAVLPMALLVVFNSLLIRSVARAAAARRNMTLGCSDSSSVASNGGGGGGAGAGGRLLSAAAAPSRGRGRGMSATAQQIASVTAADAEQQQRSVTVMLVAVVMIFFTLHAPNAVVLVLNSYEDYANEMAGRNLSDARWSQRQVASASTNFLTLLSSSVNFLLYSALSKKFRQTLRGLACPSPRTRTAVGSCSPRGVQTTATVMYGMTECDDKARADNGARTKSKAPLMREDSSSAPGRCKADDDESASG